METSSYIIVRARRPGHLLCDHVLCIWHTRSCNHELSTTWVSKQDLNKDNSIWHHPNMVGRVAQGPMRCYRWLMTAERRKICLHQGLPQSGLLIDYLIPSDKPKNMNMSNTKCIHDIVSLLIHARISCKNNSLKSGEAWKGTWRA